MGTRLMLASSLVASYSQDDWLAKIGKVACMYLACNMYCACAMHVPTNVYMPVALTTTCKSST